MFYLGIAIILLNIANLMWALKFVYLQREIDYITKHVDFSIDYTKQKIEDE